MIHIGIASYISDNINVFICWSVNNIDIQHAIDFNLPINYIQISSLSFSEEYIVFYTINYIYILNLLKVFKVIAGEIESDGYNVDLFNVGNSNCVKNGELTNSVSISCISDYNPYYVLNCNNDINQYLDSDLSEKCGSCDTDVWKKSCT